MNIRQAIYKDLQAIDEIYNQAIRGKATADTAPYSFEKRAEWFHEHEAEKYPVFVYEAGTIIAGWLSFSPYRCGRDALKYTAEISYYVHGDYQRQGIGTALLNHAIQKAPEYHFKNLFAIILEHNTGSIRLLEKFSFEKWGFMPLVADFEGKECGHIYYGRRIQGRAGH